MSIFEPTSEYWSQLDFTLLRNGSITLFCKKELFTRYQRALIDLHYEIHDFDCTKWDNGSAFHKDVARELEFPNYYGHNLDAFNDCLSECGSRVVERGKKGLVLAFYRYDSFASKETKMATIILDIIQTNSWQYLLSGQKLIGLVQSNDLSIHFDKLGAMPANWNRHEWLRKNREL